MNKDNIDNLVGQGVRDSSTQRNFTKHLKEHKCLNVNGDNPDCRKTFKNYVTYTHRPKDCVCSPTCRWALDEIKVNKNNSLFRYT